MQRPCDACGKLYEAKRSTSKWCSSDCRARIATGAAVPLSSAPSAADSPTPAGEHPLILRTRATLAKAERLETVAGQAALLIAEAMAGPRTPPAALASLSDKLLVRMAEAMEGVAKEADPIDELRLKRDRKLAGTG